MSNSFALSARCPDNCPVLFKVRNKRPSSVCRTPWLLQSRKSWKSRTVSHFRLARLFQSRKSQTVSHFRHRCPDPCPVHFKVKKKRPSSAWRTPWLLQSRKSRKSRTVSHFRLTRLLQSRKSRTVSHFRHRCPDHCPELSKVRNKGPSSAWRAPCLSKNRKSQTSRTVSHFRRTWPRPHRKSRTVLDFRCRCVPWNSWSQNTSGKVALATVMAVQIWKIYRGRTFLSFQACMSVPNSSSNLIQNCSP